MILHDIFNGNDKQPSNKATSKKALALLIFQLFLNNSCSFLKYQFDTTNTQVSNWKLNDFEINHTFDHKMVHFHLKRHSISSSPFFFFFWMVRATFFQFSDYLGWPSSHFCGKPSEGYKR